MFLTTLYATVVFINGRKKKKPQSHCLPLAKSIWSSNDTVFIIYYLACRNMLNYCISTESSRIMSAGRAPIESQGLDAIPTVTVNTGLATHSLASLPKHIVFQNFIRCAIRDSNLDKCVCWLYIIIIDVPVSSSHFK